MHVKNYHVLHLHLVNLGRIDTISSNEEDVLTSGTNAAVIELKLAVEQRSRYKSFSNDAQQHNRCNKNRCKILFFL